MKYKCIIIDDEELARNLIKSYAERLDFIEVVGTFENPLNALKVIKNEKIDLVFLDIQMPDMKGTDFSKLLPPETQIVFTTAYSEYALAAFDLGAEDYLVKPITFERFLQAINKVKFNRNSGNSELTITVKSGYDLHKVKLADIIYLESDSEYVIYHTLENKIMSNQSLKSLEEILDPAQFIRVHRSFIVNKSKITSLKSRDLFLSDIKIPVSDSYIESVKKLF